MSNTRQFIEQLAAGEASSAKNTFETILSSKAFEALDGYKKEIASGIFGGVNESEEFSEFELALENCTLEELEDFVMSEEYESLDEVSKSTLQSYLNKTAKGPESWRAHQRKATTAGGQAATIMVKRASENPTKKEAGLRGKEEQSWRKTSNRVAGENRAQARLRNKSEE